MKKILALVAALAVLWIAPAVSASNVDEDKAGADAATYPVTLPGYSSTFGVLYDVAPADYDTYILTVTSPTTVTAVIEDCCIMGDTIGLKAGKTTFKATSPEVIRVSKAVPAGKYTVFVGYLAGPGGFPAGYTATFSG